MQCKSITVFFTSTSLLLLLHLKQLLQGKRGLRRVSVCTEALTSPKPKHEHPCQNHCQPLNRKVCPSVEVALCHLTLHPALEDVRASESRHFPRLLTRTNSAELTVPREKVRERSVSSASRFCSQILPRVASH